jgi:hypothetical protein
LTVRTLARARFRNYLGSVLPGLSVFPANRIPELTPAAWATRNRSTKSGDRQPCGLLAGYPETKRRNPAMTSTWVAQTDALKKPKTAT